MRSSLCVALAAACMFSWAGRAEAEEKTESAAEKLGWRLALQCWTFNKLTFFEAVDTAAKVGIRYVEAFPGQKLKPGSNVGIGPGMSAEAMEETKQKLQSAGVKLVNLGVTGADKGTFEFAKKMGIETIVSEAAAKDLPAVDKLCEEYGINIALHNHPKPSPYWDPDIVLKAVEGRSKRIGSCSDTGHWMRSGVVPLEGLKKLEGRIVSLHFKDLDKMGGGHDVPWGTGKGDAKAMLAELQRQGFKGVFSIEYEYGGGQQLVDNVAKCVTFFEETAKELLAAKK
ncbi:MAG: sugar phosphate isomerase/epimerase [Planctomycetota bacterium]|nr:sugar phosphate isomerase/epimerase [Planctomycetota bacterium]